MQPNQKILGAFVVGFALVAGAYTLSNFGKPANTSTTVSTDAFTNQPSDRNYIAVKDSDQNGIEDWQEEFVSTTPLIIDTATGTATSFQMPTTITGQVGIQLFQSVLEAKGRGKVGPDKNTVVQNTAELLRTTVIKDTVYTINDITIIDASPDTIHTYANTMGQNIITNNIPNSEGELPIIDRALRTENPKELDKLDPIIAMYKTLRDNAISTPVPRGFEKKHTDLINVYEAVRATLDGMKLAFTDPVVALLRVKRYQNDAAGLATAHTNMYLALVPYATLFSDNEPGLVFIAFSPR